MATEDRESQVLEIDALESTYRAKKVQRLSDFDDLAQRIRGIVQIDLDSLADKPIEFRCYAIRTVPETVKIIKYLPPIRLEFELPENYPSTASPKIKISSDWMTHKQTVLCETAVEKTLLENEGMIVIFFCVEAVIEAVKNMNIEFINLNRAYIRMENPNIQLPELERQFFKAIADAEEESFQSNSYDCNVCFELTPGPLCIKFYPCSHITCKACVFEYYKSLANGMVTDRMKCLSASCETEAFDAVVREALGEELYHRYDDALLQKAIREGGDETMECARETCKMVSYVTDREKNLVECSYCGYNFCMNCKLTYHGVEACKITKEQASLLEQYDGADDEEKEEMEKEYGLDFFDHHLNKEWLVLNTKPCPNCWVNVEKNDGCNKMHCTSCGAYFCWNCQTTIYNGYAHFDDGGPCDGTLFDGIEHG